MDNVARSERMTRSSVVSVLCLRIVDGFHLSLARALETHDTHDDAGGTIGDEDLGDVPQLEPVLASASIGRMSARNDLLGQTRDDKIELDLRRRARPRDALRQRNGRRLMEP